VLVGEQKWKHGSGDEVGLALCDFFLYLSDKTISVEPCY